MNDRPPAPQAEGLSPTPYVRPLLLLLLPLPCARVRGTRGVPFRRMRSFSMF